MEAACSFLTVPLGLAAVSTSSREAVLAHHEESVT